MSMHTSAADMTLRDYFAGHPEDFRPILGDYGSLARYILRLLKNKGEV